jgi:hypothetical protein
MDFFFAPAQQLSANTMPTSPKSNSVNLDNLVRNSTAEFDSLSRQFCLLTPDTGLIG